MPRRSGDWWLVTSHSHLLIPNPCFQTFSGGFAAKKEANPASLRSAAPSKGRGLRGYTLLPMEGGAPKGRRLDGESGMKKSGGDRLKYAVCESTLSTAARSPFPDGEGKEEAASPPKEESQPRLAALGSPFQRKGLAWIHPPSYGRRAPRRGGGWMGKAVFPYYSLPRVGKVASEASRIGF